MSWSKCSVEIGPTGDNEAMATTLTSVGKVKDKSAVLEATEGEKLRSTGVGGELLAAENLEGGFALTIRVVEPDDTLLTALGLGAAASDDFDVTTHVVSAEQSLKLTPKNIGAIGIKAIRCNVTYKPGWSDSEGQFADITFEIIKTSAGKWYTRFIKAAPAQG